MSIRKICLLSILVLSMFLLVGCLSKTPITAEEFKTRMESSGYSITDATNQFGEDKVKKVYIAVSKDGGYQIEFYEQHSSSDAVLSFNQNVSTMESTKSGVNSSTSLSGSNFDKQTQTSNGEYWVVSRIENTFIFVHVNEKYKDDVKTVLSSLGY